ncbi:MAG TPA: hypothetical protein VJP77_05775 [Planctomycetota bacterium]|nr:hypothetical protein [Planctomycetota bacterium]
MKTNETIAPEQHEGCDANSIGPAERIEALFAWAAILVGSAVLGYWTWLCVAV